MNEQHLRQLDAARRRMAAAKQAFTLAAQAAQRNDPDSGQRCADAIEELNVARQALRALTDQAPGPWREVARFRDEQR